MSSDPVITENEDGTVAISHYPSQFDVSLELLTAPDKALFVHWCGLQVDVVGVRYRIKDVNVAHRMATLRAASMQVPVRRKGRRRR